MPLSKKLDDQIRLELGAGTPIEIQRVEIKVPKRFRSAAPQIQFDTIEVSGTTKSALKDAPNEIIRMIALRSTSAAVNEALLKSLRSATRARRERLVEV